ncbi:hypothetical protein SK128_004721 [Halocaridina rubra]|uniref:RRM domain-containing protein n=1 Tax=Halocaridina rubra TaxID=373956 RepID=A0AAN9A0I1_HALRR
MTSARLFIGGMGDNVDNDLLTSKLCEYGSVTNVEVKEKKDIEGNVSFRFAYINIEAPRENIEECVSQLNGTFWFGSRIRVEVAKESFLDRLKRERSQQQQEIVKSPLSYRQQSPQKYSSDVYHDKRKDSYEQHSFQVESRAPKNWASTLQESDFSKTDKYTSKQETQDTKRKDEAEEEMLTSFKAFSSVWADSDEEDTLGSKQNLNGHDTEEKADAPDFKSLQIIVDDEDDSSDEDSDTSSMSSKEKDSSSELPLEDKSHKWGAPTTSTIKKSDSFGIDQTYKTMTRYDPTRPDHLQFRMTPANFKMDVEQEESQKDPKTAESSGFSFLSMFDQLQNNDSSELPLSKVTRQSFGPSSSSTGRKNNDYQEPVREAPARLPVQKKQSFFLSMQDERIQEGLAWMEKTNQNAIVPKFEEVADDLFTIIKTRSLRAKRDFMRDNKDPEEGKRKSSHQKGKRKSDKRTELSVLEDQYYDYGWRRAVQFEEARKKNRSQNSSSNRGRQGNDVNHNAIGRGRDGVAYNRDQFGRENGSERHTHGRGRGGNYHFPGRGKRGLNERGFSSRGSEKITA